MEVINIQAAKTHLSRLVEQAIAGEEIIIGKAGKALVRLTAVGPLRKTRTGGQFKGQIYEAPDCWDDSADLLGGALEAPLYAAGPDLPALRVAEGTP